MTSLLKSNNIINQRGFALLITIVVISVVLAVGISLLNITVKQISLSITGRDSEVAFHAAQGGVECMQQLLNTTDYITGVPLPDTTSCLDNTIDVESVSIDDGVDELFIDEYQLHFPDSNGVTWSNGEFDVCTQVDAYIINATTQTSDVNEIILGQGVDRLECEAGEYCTYVFSRGYNRPCNDLSSLRTIQREITFDN